jgi:hypothetical protein
VVGFQVARVLTQAAMESIASLEFLGLLLI